MDKDIRWEQRFYNYNKALAQLEKAVALADERALTELERQGLIQSFEFTHELSWNVIKDYFEYQGITSINGPKDAVRMAFNRELITEGDTWMEMIKSRNKTSHTYNEDTATEIEKKIKQQYIQLFQSFRTTMEGLKSLD